MAHLPINEPKRKKKQWFGIGFFMTPSVVKIPEMGYLILKGSSKNQCGNFDLILEKVFTLKGNNNVLGQIRCIGQCPSIWQLSIRWITSSVHVLNIKLFLFWHSEQFDLHNIYNMFNEQSVVIFWVNWRKNNKE